MATIATNDLKDFLQNLADDICFSDHESGDICMRDYAGGNTADAFQMGAYEGQIQLARQLLVLFFKD